MPQAIPILAVAAASALKLGPFLTSIVGLAASALSNELMRDASVSESLSGIKLNTTDASKAYPVVYGKMLIGGNRVFYHAQGGENRILWLVQNFAEGECEGIEQAGGVDQVFLDSNLHTKYGAHYSYSFYGGSDSQTYDADLNTAYPQWTDNKRNTCYMVHKLIYHESKFQGLPDITILLKGRKLYDFRDESTAWSDNPVLALYDWMTNARYGLGYDSSYIDITSWTSAANYCDTKGIDINMFISSLNASGEDVKESILRLFRGTLNWWDGKFYLKYSDLNYESSVFTIEDDHILRLENGAYDIKLSDSGSFTIPDGLWIRYVDKDLDYTETRLPIGDPDESTEEITLDGCTNRELAGNIGTYLLERMQLSRAISLTGRSDLIRLEPNDIVTLNTSALGIADQTMRVLKSNILREGAVSLALAYESLDLYNDEYDVDIEDVYTCTLPDIDAEPNSVSDVSCTEEQYNYRGRTFTKLVISFTSINVDWFDHVDVYLSNDDSNWSFFGSAKTDFEILNIEEGETFYIRLKSVTIHNVKQEDENDYKIEYNVSGLTDTPTSLASLDAVPGHGSVNLYSNMIDDSDVDLYEFRLGSSWTGGIFLAALKAPNYSMHGVKPGSHTFWANVYLNNGEYGSTPRSAAITLPDPPDGWTIQNTETCDYDGIGSHDNTEHITYNSDDYLKCSHSGGVLVGTYTSPVYIRSSSDRYLIYIVADIVVVGGGTAWEDFVPSPTVWSDVNITTTKWSALYTPFSGGPAIRMTLNYGDTNPPANSVGKMEILSTVVTGRYFQVEIEITDPNDEVNAYVENFSLKFCQ